MKWKWLAVGIILLFVGTTVIPSTAQKIEKSSYLSENRIVTSQFQTLQQTKNNNDTVTITIGSGQYDQQTRTMRGIIGFSYTIENRGENEVWYHESGVVYTMFPPRYFANRNRTGNVPPQWLAGAWSAPLLTRHPFMTITVRVTVNTSTNLTLERSAIELFSCFFIGWTGPESVIGPS
jgi:hypothetical protein